MPPRPLPTRALPVPKLPSRRLPHPSLAGTQELDAGSFLLALHAALLPALARLPALSLVSLGTPRGPAPPPELLAALLGAWLRPSGGLQRLDVWAPTHPGARPGQPDALGRRPVDVAERLLV